MKAQEQANLCRVMKRADLMKAILEGPVSTDPDTLRKHVPGKIRRADWWQRTTDEQKARVVRSVIYLKLKGFGDADVAELRTAVFRMFTMGATTDPSQRRSPKNRALREKIDRLKREKGMARLTREELLELATHDELTGLPNRHAYEMASVKPVVAMADIEGLKWINDNLGHKAGDELLKRAADLFGETDYEAYRMGKGADEFVVQTDTIEQADRSLAWVNEQLKRSTIGSGGREVAGFQLTWGIGPDLETADSRMNAAKAELKQAGLRARRGDKPVAYQETVNSSQDTLVSPHRIPSHPVEPTTRRRSA
jgi:diguanylate cyclase (GGDEF)-like protein